MSVKDQWLDILLAAVFIMAIPKYGWFMGLGALYICIRHIRIIPFVMALSVILFLLMERPVYPQEHIGKVIEVKASSVIIQVGKAKVLCYEDDLIFDETVGLSGTYTFIESAPSRYGFNAEEYYRNQGVYYRFDGEAEVLKPSGSIRGKLYQIISSRKDAEWLRLFIFNIRDNASIFISCGLGTIGMLRMLRKGMSYFVTEKVSKTILTILSIIGLVIFRQLAFLRFILSILIPLLGLSRKDETGLFGVLMMIAVRGNIFQASYMIPVGIRVINIMVNRDERKWLQLFLINLFTNKISITSSYLYEPLTWIYGFLTLVAYGEVLCDVSLLSGIMHLMEPLTLIMEMLEFDSSMLGIGLICLIIVMSFFPRKTWVVFTVIWAWLGLYHPLAEVTMINVGQGDAILIRGALNRENILIDTGKSYNYNYLSSYLNGLGIRRIDTVFISHYDEDHCGGLSLLKDEFEVRSIVDEHFDEYQVGSFVFYDLNHTGGEDNDGSLVLLCNIGNRKWLFGGDAGTEVEEGIVEQYGELEVDVLKLGHHGSATSSSDDFLESVRPMLGLISVGLNNSYNHPSPEVVERLAGLRIPSLRTSINGDITIYPYGQGIIVCADHKLGLLPMRNGIMD